MKRKIIGMILVFAMMFGTTTALASDKYATRGEVADMLLNAADDYNPNVQRKDIIKGYDDGELHEDWNINRAEALVMLKRAFGDLPELTGHNARVALKSGEFTDIPEWAKAELKDVFDAGIAAGTSEGIFSPNDDVTKEQMNLFIQRVYALFGTNLKDDFYATVNKDILNALEIKPGRTVAGTLYDLTDKSTEELDEIITDVTSKTYEHGTKEQKICDFYNNILDKESRDKIGVAPILPYLEIIDKAENIDDLMAVQTELMDKLLLCPFMGFDLYVDLKDSTKHKLSFDTAAPEMDREFYLSGTEEQKQMYFKYIKKMISLAGGEITDEELESFYAYEKRLAESQISPADSNNIDKIYNLYTFDEIQAMFPSVDMDAVLKSSGFKKEDKILVMDKDLTKEFSKLFTNENIGALKTAVKIDVLNCGSALNHEFTDASDEFRSEYLGVSGTYTDKERAVLAVSNTMSDYIGEIYVDRYFSEEAKQDAKKMVYDIIDAYKNRINSLDWMSEETKKKAKNKLDKMGVKIGYPDNWETHLDDVDIKSVKDGGSYFDNLLEIKKANQAELISKQGEPVDKTQWTMYPFTVNACYNLTANDITFPAAILRTPMYDVNASYEENLGAIGYIIAHEITHAFDNNGAKFDENGNAADWWAAEDYAAFEKLCEKMKYFYEGQEGIPGVPMNGTLTLSENVADNGAVQCVTDIVSNLENPDYKTFYTSMAKVWANTKSREYAKYVSELDVHSEGKLRINRVIVNCEEFYEAFGITEKDGMYVPMEDRVKIW